MAITALPTPAPASTMSEADFDAAANALLGALPTFVTQANALASDVSDDATTATTQAGIATTKAGEAAASAVTAAAAATSASVASNSTLWISAGSYTLGQLVWSPIDFETYRAITTHSSVATDPSVDATNWLPVNGAFSGSYNDLADLPTIPTVAAIASASEIRSLTTAKTMTPEKVADAAAQITPSGASNYAPDWSAFIAAEWVVTANRTLSNPTNVIPGTTRVVTVKSSSGTARTISFGSYYKGTLPVIAPTNAAFVTLFLFAVSSTQILASDKAWA